MVCRNGLIGGFAAPQNELEHGIKTFAFVKRGFNERLRLFQAQCLARSQESAIAEQHQSAVGPKLEMAEPELFIDKAQSFIDSRPLLLRNANVWQRTPLKHKLRRTE